MSRRSNPSPTAEEVKAEALAELREVLLGIACQIVVTSGDDQLAETYLGISLEDFSPGSIPGEFRNHLETVDLNRFWIARQIGAACDFALQLGTVQERTAFGEDDWNDMAIFLEGAPRTSFAGELTPLDNEDSTLRRTIEMALARMLLMHGNALTIRQLSLLAGIGETAVRTSLSSDGIKTEGKPAQVPADVAEPWLNRRRGFVPTLTPENGTVETGLSSKAPALALELQSLFERAGLDASSLAQRAEVDHQWVERLAQGKQVPCDVAGLCRIAEVLQVDAPSFAGRAVEAILQQA